MDWLIVVLMLGLHVDGPIRPLVLIWVFCTSLIYIRSVILAIKNIKQQIYFPVMICVRFVRTNKRYECTKRCPTVGASRWCLQLVSTTI
jgi:hypothetical protein